MTTLVAARSSKHAMVERPSLSRVLALHLVPGILITVAFVAIAAITVPLDMPAPLALLMTWLVAGIPILLGILYHEGRSRNARLSLAGIVLNREPLPLRQYVSLVPILLVWSALSSTLAVPVSQALQSMFFSWVPGWLLLSTFAQNLSQYSRAVVWSVVVLSFALNIAVPIVEEMYFRGYLLPRLNSLGNWAPLINVAFFSLYHFWLPWEFPTRIITLLPIVYVVQAKKNIYVSMLVHCLLNTLGSIGLLVLALTTPS